NQQRHNDNVSQQNISNISLLNSSRPNLHIYNNNVSNSHTMNSEAYVIRSEILLDLLDNSKNILNQFRAKIDNGYNFQYPFPTNCIEYGRRNNNRTVNAGMITSMFNAKLNKPVLSSFRQNVKENLKANNYPLKNSEDLKPKLGLLNLDMKMPDTSSAEDVVKGLNPAAIGKLMDKKFTSILKRTDNLITRVSDKSSKVLVAGDVNAGKSTFVNTLLRREVMPTDQQPCTTLFCEVLGVHENDNVEEDIKLYDRKDCSTYTVIDLNSIANVMNSEIQQYSLLKVYCKDRRQAQDSLLHNGIIDIALIDCPGLNRDTLKTTALFARQEEIDVIIFVVSAENHFTLSAKEFLSNASNEKAYLFIVVNRFDNIRDKEKCKRLVLEQIKEVSPRTYDNAKELVHFVSASAIKIPPTDNIISAENLSLPSTSSASNDPVEQFDLCEEALHSFIIEKRTNSKLAPAQHFLENLVQDVGLLSELNLDHALQEHNRANMELEERKNDYEKLVEDEKKVAENAGRMIDDYCNGITRLCGQQVKEVIRNVHKDIKVEFPGFFSVWNYASDVRDAMLDKILEQIRNSESYSIHATHECITKLRSMGEDLPDINGNTTAEVDVESMFANFNHSLNIPVEISDFVDLDIHEKFNSELVNVVGMASASLVALGTNAKILHSFLKLGSVLNVYNMRKIDQNIFKSPYLNQGTSTPHQTRNDLNITGLSPYAVESIEQQKKRALIQLRSKPTDLDKYMFLAWLRNTNVRLFYRIVMDELEEITPLIYTPTVGTACLEYSNIYPFLAPSGVPDGLFLSLKDKSNLTKIIENYQPYQFDKSLTPQIAVITDGSRILGLGDLGVNGMGIPVGKLQLYVAAAGIDPRRTLPITVDLGTNNEKFLNDEFYLGLKQKRASDAEFYSFMDVVVKSLIEVYPKLLIQFEDFSSEHAFGLLEKYRENIFCFNDDIQGTGGVILSGFMNAVKLTKDIDPKEHRLVFFGAGSAGVGVAKQLLEFFMTEHKMSEEDAKNLVWLVDTKGLVTSDRGDKLAQHKIYFARSDNGGNQYKTLEEVIEYVKPTCLIGLSSTHGVFNEKILKRMAELNKQPIIFPLSNPSNNAECTFEQAMKHTNNSVIFASGTAFPQYVEPETHKVHYPGQGNNMYIFPGLGLGAILAQATKITDKQLYAAASALANSVLPEEKAQGRLLYPDLKRIRRVSAEVAAAVIVEIVEEGLASNKEMLSPDFKQLLNNSNESREKLISFVESNMWNTTDNKFFDS
ncbi:1651_t:CDS:2, partial [Entrophospora sp. SA101]